MSEEKRKLRDGWRWVKLGDVCEIIAGQSPPSSTYRDIPAGLPFFQGKTDFGKINPIPRVWCVEPKKIARKGDILISIRAPVGPTNIADIDCCIGRGLAAIRPTYEASRDFILFALKTVESSLSSKSSGSTFEAIRIEDLSSLQIKIPSLLEQQRIASLLREQMRAVDEARKAAEERLEAAQALPAAYLGQVFPRKGDPLPDGWQWEKLGSVCEINPRRPILERNNHQPTSFIPMEAVNARSGKVDELLSRPFEEIKKGYTFFQENDVLFAKITPCMQNGKHLIARGLIDGIGFGTTEFHVLRPGVGVLPEWIWYFVRQPYLLKNATEHFTGAVGQQRLPPDYLINLEIPLPPIAEQRWFTRLLDEQMQAVDILRLAAEAELKQINSLPATILRNAFNGGF